MTWALGELGRWRHGGNIGAALALAFLSTGCYATSAVIQQQEASRPGVEGVGLVRQLVRRPRWWLAVLATISGAALHIAALALGPLSAVQPVGVLTLVLALPLGARWGGRAVTGAEWQAAVAVAVGLAAVLAAVPHRLRPAHTPLLALPVAAALIAVLVLLLVGLATRLPARVAPVVRAAAAATCFGFASAMTRVAAVGAAPLPVAALLAVLGAMAGLGLAQLAYRSGGLGAPLATTILVDPCIAVLIGVTVLGEPVPLTPGRIALAVFGLAATSGGIWVLARTGSSDPDQVPVRS